MNLPPSTVGLLVMSFSARTKRIVQQPTSDGRTWPGVVDRMLDPKAIGVLLMDLSRPEAEGGSWPVLWGNQIGFNPTNDLRFYADGYWCILEAHLKNGMSKVLWNTVNQF